MQTNVVLLCLVVWVQALELSNTLGDHMVLQRDRPSMVWGFADPGVEVRTVFLGENHVATADSTGTWRQALPAQPATSTPTTISFSASDGGEAHLSDVLFGDVHICGGQSNMQFTLRSEGGIPNMTEEIARADNYPLIRVFTVGQGTASAEPLRQLNTIQHPWAVSSSAIIGGGAYDTFSAGCWFTYRDVFDTLDGTVPQGLISNNWGGTTIEQWSSLEVTQACGANNVNTLWNAMISPYIQGPMAIRTVIWYQGESNVGNALGYVCLQHGMVEDWRAKFDHEFTFGLVVISPCTCYGNNNAAVGDLRQAQLAVLDTLPKIAVSITTDLVYPWSPPNDIHPTNKQDVALRLYHQIMSLEYGAPESHPLPRFVGQTTETSGHVVVVDVTLSGCAAGCDVVPVQLPPGVDPSQAITFAVQTVDGTWWEAEGKASANGQGLTLSVDVGRPDLVAAASSFGRSVYPLNAAVNSDGVPVAGWCYTMAGTPCYLTAVAGKSNTTLSFADGISRDYVL